MRTFAAFALFAAVAPAFAQKVDFVHDQSSKKKLVYDLDIQAKGENEFSTKSVFDLSYGAKSDKGVQANLNPTVWSMKINGNEMSQIAEAGQPSFILDSHGLPTAVNMSGPEMFFVISLLLSYLPAAELAEGDEYKIDWAIDGVAFKGTGKFSGYEEAGDKKLPRLSVRAVLTPGAGDSASFDFTQIYDPAAKALVRATGSAKLSEETFSLALTVK
ncbi:MAG: hypothetical protein KIT11_03855 [Fimbriimonadaceae bacterium]|nr:hypothetical protein [Fimbriimonadaceae bacterium]QYK56968.1 MAG: hypothetical protein KF733_05670 [Fimbriimonadaceae bacterium]